jgi:putative transposase
METGEGHQPRVWRRTGELRKGRQSIPGARYFVTFATDERAPWLKSGAAIAAAHLICAEMVEERTFETLTMTVMPDHVHLLFQLGERLTVDRAVAKWRALVRQAVAGLRWQPNFFEHRLRADETSETYAFYVFMNPYRAALIDSDLVWPGWWADGGVAYEFLARARVGPRPQPEWVEQKDDGAKSLAVGE